jgi:DNA polymerase
VIFVGEQPGDQEDRVGRPFVGPAGKLLDRALLEAGIDRAEVYLTNTVKHFKWEPVGKRRLHKKPGAREIAACRPWLEAELAVIEPEVVVALGATAAQALLGRGFLVSRARGRVVEGMSWARVFIATVHPSSILRGLPDERERAFTAFVADLRQVALTLAERRGERTVGR